MRLITKQEACLPQIRALAQRGINYQDEVPLSDPLEPIIDAAYVTLPFQPRKSATSRSIAASWIINRPLPTPSWIINRPLPAAW